MVGILKGKEPWATFAFASAALGLALYYLHANAQPSAAQSDEKEHQVKEEPCQDEDAVNAMDPEVRAYHERFMREAIAMVSQVRNISPVHTLIT
jgi:tRNA-specific adenosine deaminase 2